MFGLIKPLITHELLICQESTYSKKEAKIDQIVMNSQRTNKAKYAKR